MDENTTAKKYLSLSGLTKYDTLIKADVANKDAEVLAEAKSDRISVEGGGALTLTDIFGEPPYTIEVTEELDEFANITVVPNTDYETYRLRNVAILTEVPTVMNDGDIALVIKSGV